MMVMVMQMGGGIGDDHEKVDDFGVHKQLCCSFFMLLSMIYLKARSLSLSFSNICEGMRFWESGNLSNAASSSSFFVTNLDDDDDDGDDVGVRI